MNRLQEVLNKISPDDQVKELVRRRVMDEKRRRKSFRFAAVIASCAACIFLMVCILPMIQKNKGVYFGAPAAGVGDISAGDFGDAVQFLIYDGQYYQMGESYRTTFTKEEDVNTSIPYSENAASLIGEKLGTTALNELDINQEGFYREEATNYADLTSNAPGMEVYTVKGYDADTVRAAIDSWGIIRFFLPVQQEEA